MVVIAVGAWVCKKFMKDVIWLIDTAVFIGIGILLFMSFAEIVVTPFHCKWSQMGWKGSLAKIGREVAIGLAIAILALVVSGLCSFINLDILRPLTADPRHSFVCGFPIPISENRQNLARFAILSCRLCAIFINHFCWSIILAWALYLKTHRHLWRRIAISVLGAFLVYPGIFIGILFHDYVLTLMSSTD